MSAHTPGPWSHESDKDDVYSLAAYSTVAKTFGATLAERAANALLIAAAPELLEALELAEFALEGKRHDEDPTLKTIRSAIAKARGGK